MTGHVMKAFRTAQARAQRRRDDERWVREIERTVAAHAAPLLADLAALEADVAALTKVVDRG